jgi:hypothetical protein
MLLALEHAARVAALGVRAVDDGLLVHLKRIVARMRYLEAPTISRPAAQ